VILPLVLGVLGFAIDGIRTGHGDSIFVAAVFQLILTLIYLINLHGHRYEIRRHERDQLYVWLVGNSVPPDQSKALLAKLDADWEKHTRDDLVISGLAVLPVFGIGALAAVARRLRDALELHEEHERLLPPASSKTIEKPTKAS
jgi:hypothetical protein